MRPGQPARRVVLTSLLRLIACGPFAQPVLGATRVAGGIDAIKVEARDASLAEVLAAVSARAGVKIRLSNLPDQRIDGSFEGPLRWVLARLLAGRSYIARYSDGTLDIVGVSASGPPPNATTADPPPPAPVRAVGRRTRNEAVSAAARAAARTTGAGEGEPRGEPSE